MYYNYDFNNLSKENTCFLLRLCLNNKATQEVIKNERQKFTIQNFCILDNFLKTASKLYLLTEYTKNLELICLKYIDNLKNDDIILLREISKIKRRTKYEKQSDYKHYHRKRKQLLKNFGYVFAKYGFNNDNVKILIPAFFNDYYITQNIKGV